MLATPSAYAAYQAYGATTQYVPYQQRAATTNKGYTQQQYAPVTGNSRLTTAANPNRVTGTLPRVGTSSAAAGRQYYQPEDYDRLADSGLYIGLSVGYSTAVSGGMDADYKK